jgi:hypothetical protein
VNEHQLRDAYEAALRNGTLSRRSLHLPLERLEALVGHEGTEAERLRSIDVLMSTAEGRREFEVAWAAARAAGARNNSSRAFLTRWRTAITASAATLLVASSVFVIGRPGRDSGEIMRGEESPVRLLAPGADVSSVGTVQFAWRPVDQARDYMLVVVDTAGGDVFARSTTDTSVTLPDSVRLAPGSEYLWWVQAIMPDGSTLSAVTERFRVVR